MLFGRDVCAIPREIERGIGFAVLTIAVAEFA